MTHGAAGLKAVTKEVRVVTCTGELVEPQKICVVCSDCGGHDSVVAHCRCGVALCRRCVHPDPKDGAPRCRACFQQAIETFNTWSAHDRSQPRRMPREGFDKRYLQYLRHLQWAEAAHCLHEAGIQADLAASLSPLRHGQIAAKASHRLENRLFPTACSPIAGWRIAS